VLKRDEAAASQSVDERAATSVQAGNLLTQRIGVLALREWSIKLSTAKRDVSWR